MTKMIEINSVLVKKLIRKHFPQWANLPVRPVKHSGWDNRTFHLGDSMSVRLPSHQRYAAQVQKEQRWLPFLANQLPLSIPVPVAMGKPSDDYPFHWSIYRWIEGENAEFDKIKDIRGFANSLGKFLKALHKIPTQNAPVAGVHNFHRGGCLRIYHQETMETLQQLDGRMDTSLAEEIWQEGLQSEWTQDPVWVHGDISPSNLLLVDGALNAVIDFGCMGIGDPACDLTIAWALLDDVGRKVFKDAVSLDASTWARARSWAIWKALITYNKWQDADSLKAQEAQRVLQIVIRDHLQR